ncbi:MAG: hypothetical protein AAGF12_16245 [Myxococcota bacterium]
MTRVGDRLEVQFDEIDVAAFEKPATAARTEHDMTLRVGREWLMVTVCLVAEATGDADIEFRIGSRSFESGAATFCTSVHVLPVPETRRHTNRFARELVAVEPAGRIAVAAAAVERLTRAEWRAGLADLSAVRALEGVWRALERDHLILFDDRGYECDAYLTSGLFSEAEDMGEGRSQPAALEATLQLILAFQICDRWMGAGSGERGDPSEVASVVCRVLDAIQRRIQAELGVGDEPCDSDPRMVRERARQRRDLSDARSREVFDLVRRLRSRCVGEAGF